MKSVFILILIVSASFPALAQQVASYFQLSKIPEKDFILLDSGWKFHAGDNADWAKPSSNELGWQPINPSKRIDELPEVQNAGILWLRLALHVPEEMQGKTLSLGIDQIGASEIYLNGKLIEQYGTVSADFDKEVTFNPLSRPLYVELAKEPVQVLVVRYSFNKRNVHTKWFSHVFMAKIGTTATA
jgi:two-component system NtrC family sensor kinase